MSTRERSHPWFGSRVWPTYATVIAERDAESKAELESGPYRMASALRSKMTTSEKEFADANGFVAFYDNSSQSWMVRHRNRGAHRTSVFGEPAIRPLLKTFLLEEQENCVCCLAKKDNLSPESTSHVFLVMLLSTESTVASVYHDLCFVHRRQIDIHVEEVRKERGE